MLSMPAALASSTPYWMIGLSTSGSISLGCALVTGRNLVPRPAAGKTALRTLEATARSYQRTRLRREYTMDGRGTMLDPRFIRDHIEEVRAGLRNRGLDTDNALEDNAT